MMVPSKITPLQSTANRGGTILLHHIASWCISDHRMPQKPKNGPECLKSFLTSVSVAHGVADNRPLSDEPYPPSFPVVSGCAASLLS